VTGGGAEVRVAGVPGQRRQEKKGGRKNSSKSKGGRGQTILREGEVSRKIHPGKSLRRKPGKKTVGKVTNKPFDGLGV